MPAKPTDFYKSLLSMQPRQLRLVFCSENNNAKQALPDQKDSRKLEMSALVMKKGRSSEVTSKSVQKMNGVYSHTHTYIYFSPFYLLARAAFRPGFFGFVLLKLEAAMWLRDTVLGKETQLRIDIQVQAPKHIPWMLSPTDLSGTSAQELTHLTALSIINAIPLKISRAKVQD